MLEEQKTKSDWPEREMGAFWTRDSSKGKYLSGSIEVDELGVKRKIKVIMFPNRYKDNDKKPDYILYLSKDSDANISNNTDISSSNNENVSSDSVKNEEIPDSLV